ncbi:site-2 protease family protein [Neomicrococcus lactis]|uniref:site-2 protease family protein n=1 Tax=Neomicrococcus lactis TaxID=732241 RepID=UPI0023016D86|nr:site-2 protease family protein [Neomicrococcus lactis]
MSSETVERRSFNIPLGKVGSVPLYLAPSWFVIAAIIVFMFGPDIQRLFPTLGVGAYGIAFLYAVFLAVSVLIHELAHALTAGAFGWRASEIVLTLWGGHTQFTSAHTTPWKSLAVALAGPAANLVLAGIGHVVSITVQPSGPGGLLLSVLVWANFLVAIFNLLPGLPLDGGRLVESIVWSATGSQSKGTVAAGWAGRAIVVGLVGYFLVWPLLMNEPVQFQFLLIVLLVCGFLWMGAGQAIKFAGISGRVDGIRAADLMEPAVGIAQDVSLAQLDANYGAFAGTVFLVSPQNQPIAVVDPAAAGNVPTALRTTTPLASVSRFPSRIPVVPAASSGRSMVDFLAKFDAQEIAVVDEAGKVCGLMRQERIVDAVLGKK